MLRASRPHWLWLVGITAAIMLLRYSSARLLGDVMEAALAYSFSSGAWALMVLGAAWYGIIITHEFKNLPAREVMELSPVQQAAPLAQGYASDVQNHIAPPDPFASLNDKQWRRLAFLVSEGVDNLPYEKLCPKSANGFSRPQWERLRGILLETRNAYASGNQVILNKAGREMIRRRANSPTAGAFR